MEKKIILPKGYELVESGNEYIVRKKYTRPKSWKEFCKNYPRTTYEYFIGDNSNIEQVCNTIYPRDTKHDKNICTSKEEAEAFLALMQLRQLRKAWVGDWKFTEQETTYGVIPKKDGSIGTGVYGPIQRNMLFPTREMAEDFLNCFKDLCKTAKPLL